MSPGPYDPPFCYYCGKKIQFDDLEKAHMEEWGIVRVAHEKCIDAHKEDELSWEMME